MKNLEQKIKDIINSYEEKETIVFEGTDIICDGKREFQYFSGTIDELVQIWDIEIEPHDLIVDLETMMSVFNIGSYYCYEVEENVFLYRLF